MRSKGFHIAFGAVTAAIYVILTILAWGANLAFGLVQVRFSEALCVLAYFSPCAVGGLFVGCLVANLLTGAILPDIIFGSLATLFAAMCTYWIRLMCNHKPNVKLLRWLVPLPAVIINALVIGALLIKVYGVDVPYYLACVYVGIGQTLACYGLGMPLMFALQKTGILGR